MNNDAATCFVCGARIPAYAGRMHKVGRRLRWACAACDSVTPVVFAAAEARDLAAQRRRRPRGFA